ncbi:MAG TPA: hypothetical protein VF159_01430 [Gemmatimonadaceae bacterium]
MTRTLMLFVALITSAGRLQAQQPLASVPGFDEQTRVELEQIVERTATRGLPPQPIVVKARFAALMHAPGPKIVSVARAVADRLEVARTALAPQPTAGDIKAGEDALSAGVTPDALRLVRAVRPDRPVAVPLGLLAQLVATGVPVARASKIVTDLMRKGADSQQLVALGNDVNSDVALGERAEAALDLRTQALDAVLGSSAAGAGLVSTNTPSAPGVDMSGGNPVTSRPAGRPRRP